MLTPSDLRSAAVRHIARGRWRLGHHALWLADEIEDLGADGPERLEDLGDVLDEPPSPLPKWLLFAALVIVNALVWSAVLM